MAKNRVEGQIWIDRNSPYKLKYYVHGEEFEVSVSQNYHTGGKQFTAGNVVRIGDDGNLEKAIFPQDIDRVIGVVAVTNAGSSDDPISVLESDNLLLFQDDITAVFREDLGITASNVTEKRNEYIGAPVYWFIGATESYEEGGETKYRYIDSSEYQGLLTLNTPSGYQWKQTQISDDSLNVGYSNLPTIGHVSRLWLDKEDNKIRMIINLHMTGFSNEQTWVWPHFYKNGDRIVGLVQKGIIASEGPRERESITIRHGLFPNNSDTLGTTSNVHRRPRCFCDVIAMPVNEHDDTEYVTCATVDNFLGQTEEEAASNDRRTEVYVRTYEDLRYSITGRVQYNFNKEFEARSN